MRALREFRGFWFAEEEDDLAGQGAMFQKWELANSELRFGISVKVWPRRVCTRLRDFFGGESLNIGLGG